jgi:hypothetical protein
VEVRPPSAHRETVGVARAVFHVVFWCGLFVSAQTFDARSSSAATNASLSPYERRFQDLPFEDQRIFRNVQEGVADAARARSATGRWPRVEDLAARGVPPFAVDPIDRAHYRWHMLETGRTVDYVGIPDAASGRDAFFVIISEPDPGTPDDPLAKEDDEHFRLANGPMIHLSIWVGPALVGRTSSFAVLPVEDGYRMILSGTTK